MDTLDLIYAKNFAGGGGGGGSSSVLRVSYTVDWDNMEITACDKTFNEIMSAYNNGAYIYAEDEDGEIYHLLAVTESSQFEFIRIYFNVSAGTTITKILDDTIVHGYDSVGDTDYFNFISASKSL